MSLSVFSGSAVADGGGSSESVTIRFANGTDVWLNPDVDTPDILGQPYSVVTTPGASPQSVAVTGYSLESLMSAWEQQTGVSSSQFSFVQIGSSIGATVVLPTAEAMSDPASTAQAPVLWVDGQGNTDFADANPADYLPVENGHGLNAIVSINLYTGSEVPVQISTTSKEDVPEGTKVTFTSTVSGQTPGAAVTENWMSISPTVGGHLGNGATQQVDFGFQGTYYVYVVATTGGDGSIGLSNQIEIVVGPPKKANKPGSDGTSHKATAPHTGPGTKGSATGKEKGKTSAAHSNASNTATSQTSAPSTTQPAAAKAPPTPAKRQVTNRRHPSVKRRQSSGPLLSGTAVTSPPSGASSSQGRSASPALGVANPAHTGYVTTPHHGFAVGEPFWLTLATLALLSVGGLFEWMSPRKLWQEAMQRWPWLRSVSESLRTTGPR
jgi:hypothetical protein